MAKIGKPKGSKGLSFKRRIAVQAYLSGMTKKKAMIEAGYRPKTRSDYVFCREDVRAEIKRLEGEVLEKFDVSREWMTKQLVDVATAGVALSRFKKITKDGKLDWDFTGATNEELSLIDALTVETQQVAGGKVKVKKFSVKMPSRLSALESLCRICGFNKETVVHEGEMTLIERLQRGRDRAGAGNGKD